MSSAIPGYDYDRPSLATSPVNMADLDLVKATLLWSEDDDRYLRMAGEVLRPQVEEVLDLWYGYVGGNAHLVHYFSKDSVPQPGYLAAVRQRFGQWIMDLCERPYDQKWLNYQHEIALRHHSTRKNQTDGADAVPIIHGRYMMAFIYPITATIRGFLQKGGHSGSDVDGMHNAWFKAVTLTVVLWTQPYFKAGEF